MRNKLREYRDVCLLLAAFCVLGAVVLFSWRGAARGLPDTVGRGLTREELAEVMGRNSPLTSYVCLSPNATFPRQDSIQKITIHHMAGDISLERLGEVFTQQDRQASANYAVDGQGRVALYVEEANRAWTSSSPDNDHQAVTIEVANDETGGSWHVSDAAYETLIDLCTDICRRNGIEELVFTGDERGNLTIHKMFNPDTQCPGPYLEGRMPEIAAEVSRRLTEKNG